MQQSSLFHRIGNYYSLKIIYLCYNLTQLQSHRVRNEQQGYFEHLTVLTYVRCRNESKIKFLREIRNRIKQIKRESFAPFEQRETIHHVERYKEAENGQEGDENNPVLTSVRLTEEIAVLSTAHGRIRR